MKSLTSSLDEILAVTEKFSEETLRDYQRSQLEQLLRLAFAASPYYRTRLKPLFDRKDINWKAWQDIPILTRNDVRSHGADMLIEKLPKGHGPSYSQTSSGTTGEPVSFQCTNLMLLAGAAALRRANRWYGHVADDRGCIVMSPGQVADLQKDQWAIGSNVDDRVHGNPLARQLAVSWTWSADHILSLMTQHRSTWFAGYSTTLENIAEAQLQRTVPMHLKFLVGTSMAVTERARSLARQAFNAPVYSAYTSKEAHKMAHECAKSRGLHVNSELVFLEVLDDEGKPCGIGETGRLIVTPLFGTAQPLVRYEHGDLVTWGEPCPCGRAHPVLARIDGRMRNQFRFSNGHRFMPGIGHDAFRDLLRARKWQVAQIGACEIEVRYIAERDAGQPDETAMTAYFRKSYRGDLSVKYQTVETMPLTKAGKFLDYVNEYER